MFDKKFPMICRICGHLFKTYFKSRDVCNKCLLRFWGIEYVEDEKVINCDLTLWDVDEEKEEE